MGGNFFANYNNTKQNISQTMDQIELNYLCQKWSIAQNTSSYSNQAKCWLRQILINFKDQQELKRSRNYRQELTFKSSRSNKA